MDVGSEIKRKAEEALRREWQVAEAAHRAEQLATFYTTLVAGGVPEDEAFTYTMRWMKQGMC